MIDNNNISKSCLQNFYEDIDKKSGIKLFFLLISSLGIYIIKWIYFTNLSFEKADKNAPQSSRGAAILFIMPSLWLLFTFFFRLLFEKLIQPFKIIDITVWGIITFLSLQYLYDFCLSYARITNTNGIIWYLLIYPGYYSVILLLFKFYYTIVLIIMPFVVIPIMQSIINKKASKYLLEDENNYFNQRAPQQYY